MMKEKAMTLWSEINLSAINRNIQTIRKLININTKIMGVVKFDAYGHGAVEIGKSLVKNGIDALGVASTEEGIELRKAGIEAPILIMNMSLPDTAMEIIQYDLTPMVCSLNFVNELDTCSQKAQKKLGIHIRVDISDSNIGVKPEDFERFLKKVEKKKNLFVTGLFTHLISAYVGDIKVLVEEIKRFKQLLSFFNKESSDTMLVHALSSPGIFRLPEADFSMMRIGTSLFGLPSYKNQDMKDLEPVMQLKTRIIDICINGTQRHMEYTGVTAIKKNIRTGLIPVGYGYVPAFLFMRNGKVLVNGAKVSILGRAFMGHMIIDITQLPDVKIGDEVVIFGRQQDQYITVEEVAEKCGIDVEKCESICMMDRRIKHVYMEESRGET